MNGHANLLDSALMAIIAASSLLAQIPVSVPVSIFADSQLRLYCIIGALGGAWTTVELFSRETATRKQRAAKMLTSSVVSILFTPSLFTWLNLPRNSDYLMGLACAVAIIGVAVIQGIYNKTVNYAVRRLTPPGDTPASDSAPETPRTPRTEKQTPTSNP